MKSFWHKVLTKPDRIKFHLKQKILYLYDFNIINYFKSRQSFQLFKQYTFNKPTVLIIEFNKFHAETLPGYTNYFNRLGYDVVVLMNDDNYKLRPFCDFKKEMIPKIFVMNPMHMKKSLKLKQVENYELIFVSSHTFVEPFGFWGSVPNYLKFFPKAKKNTIYMEHDINDIDYESPYLDQICTLFPKENNGHCFPMINPHYFGDVSITSMNKTKIFITVGALTDRNRTAGGLIEAVENIVTAGITDFKIWIIGKVSEEQIKQNNIEQIEYLGYLNFQELYKCMELADFYLPLLDKENPGNLRYLNGQTTGSLQLILGFAKVPIIQEQFATYYGLNEENAIMQTFNLEDDIRKAIDMEVNMYEEKQKNLLTLSKKYFENSFNNLKNIIDESN